MTYYQAVNIFKKPETSQVTIQRICMHWFIEEINGHFDKIKISFEISGEIAIIRKIK